MVNERIWVAHDGEKAVPISSARTQKIPSVLGADVLLTYPKELQLGEMGIHTGIVIQQPKCPRLAGPVVAYMIRNRTVPGSNPVVNTRVTA